VLPHVTAVKMKIAKFLRRGWQQDLDVRAERREAAAETGTLGAVLALAPLV
jgi:hypothetical protein